MRKSIAIIIIFGLIGFIGVFALAKKNNDGKILADCSAKTCVALKQDRADPDTISVPIGSYVQFNSADGKNHQLSLGKGGEGHSHTGKFQSPKFKADEGWKVQFNDEGSFFFHDHLNPKINVLVVVYTPGKDYKLQ